MRFATDHSINITKLSTGEERNTLYHWHMQPASELSFQPPEPKYSYEDSPGTDGDLDSTEAVADRVLYNNRHGEWEFYITNKPLEIPNLDDTISWAQMQSDLSNFLQGQKVQITLADDPDYYYIGRLHITGFDPNKHYQHVTIEYNVKPYKYEFEEYESELTTTPTSMTVGGATINIPVGFTFNGSDMPTIPEIDSLSSKKYYYPEQQLTRGLAVLMIYNSIAKINSANSLNISTDITISESQFLDVDPDADYYDALLWAEGRGWVGGYTNLIFAPNNGMTRAQFFTVLWRVMGMPAGAGKAAFTDVSRNSYYYKAVQWAFTNGLAVGDGNGHFMPDAVISRQQAIFVIWKLCGSPNSTSTQITDVENGTIVKPWYYDACKKLKEENIIAGYSDNTWRPGNSITRIHFVTLIWSMYGKPDMSSITLPFTDLGQCSADQIKALKWMYSMDWVSGTTSTTFSPARAVYRKEAIQWLFNFGNYVAYTYQDSDLEYVDVNDPEADWVGNGYQTPSDVSVSAYYYHAVCWALINEVTALDNGYKFNPEQELTRGMAAQMLFKIWCRWTKTYPTYNTAGSAFKDVVCYVLNYATAVYWGYNQGILTSAFVKNGHMHLIITNQYGRFVADVPYGTHEAPELLIAPGENTVLPLHCAGQYRIRFKRGSL